MDRRLEDRAAELVKRLAAEGKTLAAAESCTAGLVADLIARIPGASAVFWGSFVTYTTEAKAVMLGLDRGTVEKHGAVSGETACAMAGAALEKSGASLALSVTGLAGPSGDGTATPVGTVWIGRALKGGGTSARVFHFEGSRNGIRRAAAAQVIEDALNCL